MECVHVIIKQDSCLGKVNDGRLQSGYYRLRETPTGIRVIQKVTEDHETHSLYKILHG